MNRKLKRISALFLTLAMLLLALPGQLLTVYAASGKITFSDPSASVGNQVSVNMKIAYQMEPDWETLMLCWNMMRPHWSL